MPEHRKTLSRSFSLGQREAVAIISPGVSAELKPLDHVSRRTQQLTLRIPKRPRRVHLVAGVFFRTSPEFLDFRFPRLPRRRASNNNSGKLPRSGGLQSAVSNSKGAILCAENNAGIRV